MDDNEVPIRQRNAAVPARRAPPPVTDIFSGKATVIVKKEKKAAPVVKDYASDSSTVEIVAENLGPKVLVKNVKSKQKAVPKRSDAKAQNDRVKAVKIDRCVFPP